MNMGNWVEVYVIVCMIDNGGVNYGGGHGDEKEPVGLSHECSRCERKTQVFILVTEWMAEQ
jgi:hypothetical protein